MKINKTFFSFRRRNFSKCWVTFWGSRTSSKKLAQKFQFGLERKLKTCRNEIPLSLIKTLFSSKGGKIE